MTLSNENFKFKGLDIYPNPFNDILKINIEEEATVSIVDVTGKRLKSQKLILGLNQIDTTDQKEGLYFVKIENEKGAKTIKMMKY